MNTAKNYQRLLIVVTIVLGLISGTFIGFGIGAQLFNTDAPWFIISVVGGASAFYLFLPYTDSIQCELRNSFNSDKS
jgi:F0F1-type ATP synthase assembly protein I